MFGPVVCAPEGRNVRCSVQFWESATGWRDVTAHTTLIPSAHPLLTQPTDIAAVVQPGLLEPRAAGNIGILAIYEGRRSSSNRAFSIGPDRDALVVAPYVRGFVSVAGGNTPVADVLIEILDGPDAGQSAATLINGSYSISFITLNAEFTVRASKPGFETQTKRHTGIRENSFGAAENNFLHFQMAPR